MGIAEGKIWVCGGGNMTDLDDDIYTEDGLGELMDEDGLSDWEEGFMMGFMGY